MNLACFDKWLVLGILVVALTLGPAIPSLADELTDAFRHDGRAQGMAAVTLARQALEYACRTHEPLPLPKELPPLLRRRGAVFVSTMVSGTGAPRCCMGTLSPIQPTLADEIIQNAYLAALGDKRFPLIQPKELPNLRVIVSIIGESVPITDPTILDPLIDGLAVRGPRETGVVLPGEARTVETMCAWGRIRAKLPPDATAEYFRLTAVRFIEDHAPATREVTHASTRH